MNHWVIAAIPAVILFFWMKEYFPAFRIELVDHKQYDWQGLRAYADFNGDGYSETFLTADYADSYRYFTLNDNAGRFINEWTFPGKGIDPERPLMTGDYDRNGYPEAYLVTIRNDSLFLSCIEPMNPARPGIRTILLDTTLSGQESYFFGFHAGKITDLDGDGFGEAVFAVTGGYCKQPRRVYAYDVKRDTLLRSPLGAAQITSVSFYDMTGDGREEILVTTYAPGNCRKDEFPYHDSSSWLMVFDQRLRFCFEPLEFKGRTSATIPIPAGGGKRPGLALLRWSNEKDHLFGSLDRIDPEGRVSFSKPLSPAVIPYLRLFTHPDRPGAQLFAVMNHVDRICRLGEQFDTLEVIRLGHRTAEGDLIYDFDIDGDGHREILLRVEEGNALAVLDRNMKVKGILPVSMSSHHPFFSLRNRGDLPPSFVITEGKQLFEYLVKKNPWYRFRLPALILAYLGIALLVWGIKYLGRYQFERQAREKNRMAALQALVVQNQLNPHFIVNALNSISASIYNDRKSDALEKLKHFTELIRASLLDSTRLERSLEEEIGFVTHYLEVERAKMDFPFDYRLEIDPEVDISTEVPKMILHTFVENSIKHGLRPLNRTGLLTITITCKSPGYLFICITDNGVGRSQAMKTSSLSSTGKGQQVISDLIELHNAMKKHPITWEIRDLTGDDGQPAGTMVEVRMPVGGE